MVEIRSLSFDDFDAFRELLQGWDTSPVQISSGPVRIALDLCDANGLMLSRLFVNRKIADTSSVGEGWLGFVVCLGRKVWCGREVPAGSLVILDAGRDYRCFLDEDWASIEIFASIDELAREGLPVDVFLAACRRLLVLPLPAALLAAYRDLARLTFDSDAECPIIRPAHQLLRSRILNLLGLTADQIAPRLAGSSGAQCGGYRLTATAMEVIEQDAGYSLDVAGVSKVIGVSPRALSAAFGQTLGISTYQYMLALRLNRARQALRTPADTSMSVTGVAMENGFHHLSRFASYYRRIFGELPSRTRRPRIVNEWRLGGQIDTVASSEIG